MNASDTQRRQLAAAKGRVSESIKAAAAVMAEAEKVTDEIKRLRAEIDNFAAAGDADKLVRAEAMISANQKILKALHERKWFPAALNVEAMRRELRGMELTAATAEREVAQSAVDEAMAVLETLRRRLSEAAATQEKLERGLETTPDEGLIRKLAGDVAAIRKAAQDPVSVVSRLQLGDVLSRWESAKYIPSRAVVYYFADSGDLAGEPLVFETQDHAGNSTGRNGANCDAAVFSEKAHIEALLAARR